MAFADKLMYSPALGGTGPYTTAKEAAQAAAATYNGTVYDECLRDFSNGNRNIWFNVYLPAQQVTQCGVYARASCQRPDGSYHTPTVPGGKYLQCSCPTGQQWDAISNQCVAGPKNFGASNCSALHENPIHAGWGNKVQREMDYAGPGGLALVRTYNSKLALTLLPPNSAPMAQYWGANWRSTYDRRILVNNAYYTSLTVLRPDGAQYSFTGSYGNWQPTEADVPFKLTLPSGGGGSFQLRDLLTDEVEVYDNTGRLLSLRSQAGVVQTLTYSDGTAGANGGYVLDASGNPTSAVLPAGLLIRIINTFGQQLKFGYDSAHVVQMVDPAGGIYRYGYDANQRLISTTDPSGAVRQYFYNEPANVAFDLNNYAHALTGIIDESGTRFATLRIPPMPAGYSG